MIRTRERRLVERERDRQARGTRATRGRGRRAHDPVAALDRGAPRAARSSAATQTSEPERWTSAVPFGTPFTTRSSHAGARTGIGRGGRRVRAAAPRGRRPPPPPRRERGGCASSAYGAQAPPGSASAACSFCPRSSRDEPSRSAPSRRRSAGTDTSLARSRPREHATGGLDLGPVQLLARSRRGASPRFRSAGRGRCRCSGAPRRASLPTRARETRRRPARACRRLEHRDREPRADLDRGADAGATPPAAGSSSTKMRHARSTRPGGTVAPTRTFRSSPGPSWNSGRERRELLRRLELRLAAPRLGPRERRELVPRRVVPAVPDRDDGARRGGPELDDDRRNLHFAARAACGDGDGRDEEARAREEPSRIDDDVKVRRPFAVVAGGGLRERLERRGRARVEREPTSRLRPDVSDAGRGRDRRRARADGGATRS